MDEGNEWNSSDNLPRQLTYQDATNLYNADIDVLSSPSFRSGFSVHLNTPDVKPRMEPARLVNREFLTFSIGLSSMAKLGRVTRKRTNLMLPLSPRRLTTVFSMERTLSARKYS